MSVLNGKTPLSLRPVVSPPPDRADAVAARGQMVEGVAFKRHLDHQAPARDLAGGGPRRGQRAHQGVALNDALVHERLPKRSTGPTVLSSVKLFPHCNHPSRYS